MDMGGVYDSESGGGGFYESKCEFYLKKLLTTQAFCVITIISKGLRAFDDID